MIADPLISTAARWFVGALLLASALHKLRAFGAFRQAVAAYRLLPEAGAAPVATLLALAELATGSALLLEIEIVSFAIVSISIFGLYLAAMAINIVRGSTRIDCGCSFSTRAAPLSVWHLARNFVLMTISAFALLPSTERTLTTFDGVQVAAALAGLGLLYLSMDVLLANRGYLARE